MNHIVSASLLLLTGICVYAAINHAFIAFQRPFSRVHFLFSLFCISLVVFEIFHLLIYSATSIPSLVTMLKWELSAIVLVFAIFPWYIHEYSGIGPRWFLKGLTIIFIVLLFVNIIEPYSFQYLNITGIEQIHLPWGEELARPVGQTGALYKAGAIVVLVVFFYALYALYLRYYRDRLWTTLCMLLAIGLLVITGIEGMLVRMSVINFIHLGPFGILAMIMAMSLALSQEMQQKLHTTENRFRSLVEQSPFSIQILSPDGHTLTVNHAWQKLWGVSETQIRNYNPLYDPQLREKGVTPYLEQGFAGLATEIPPVNYNPADNSLFQGPSNSRWVRAYVYPIKDDKNTVREVVLVHEDVTEKKRFEDAIHHIATGVTEIGEGFFRQLVKYLSQLFETRYAFIGVLDNTNPTLITTIAASEYGKLVPNFNYDLKGTPCANVIGKRTCIYPQGVQQLFPEDHLLVEMAVEGYLGTPLYDAEGTPRGIIVLLDNHPLSNTEQMKAVMEIIAARTAAELDRVKADDYLQQQHRHLREMVDAQTAELQATLKELESFSYSVSHDLRAPLRSIDGFSQVILEDYNDRLDAAGKDYLGRIRNNVQRMALLIDNLLQLSRINRKDLVKQPVNISKLVLESLNKLQEEDAGRMVRTIVTPNVIVHGDQDLLAIAVDNLISNAWKYTNKTSDPEIEFGKKKIGGKSVCYIKDNGIGFDMKDVEKIFGAFQRLHSNEQFEGTGIGLATVLRIIRRHQGEVWADAKPNKGATFYFRLPDENSMDRR